MNRLFGLVGFPLGHSWSKRFFDRKFETLGINNVAYELFPIEHADQIKQIISDNADLEGFNVTIPHKTQIIPFLDSVDPTAAEINAVNVVRIVRKANQVMLHGYNTDAFGFEHSIKPLLKSGNNAAIILGTGGAAKAAAWVFRKLKMDYFFVSRHSSASGHVGYSNLSRELMKQNTVIVNATPLGMEPDVQSHPPIPYEFLDSRHLLFDMIYNPEQTTFLQKGSQKGARIKNGLEMLHLQAEKAWEIWNS